MMFSVILNRTYSMNSDDEMARQVYFGNFFHCLTFESSESVLNGFIAVEDGKIIKVGASSEYAVWDHPKKNDFHVIRHSETQFLLPGFVDTHIHAPQVPNIGLGLDKPLMDWLNAYTFPIETQYKDDAFAKHVYEKVIRRTLDSGTTTATYFGTIHKSACKILADEAHRFGQRAFIGKVAMNRNSPDTYVEKLDESISDNIELIEYVNNLGSDLLIPIITPRFAITCSPEMMTKLAQLAKDYNLPIQSHISENLDEINFTLEIFPGCKNYAEVYDKVGILTNRCIMAHCVHLTDDEVKLFAQRGTSVSHCPNSNTNLKSGMCDVKRLIAGNLKVGLGTDISGGNRISMLDALRSALDVSHHLSFMKKQNVMGTGQVAKTDDNEKYVSLDYKQGVYLATLGGASALSMDHKIGNFLVGKDFDALLIETYAGSTDKFDMPKVLTENMSDEDKFLQLLQKYVYTGDDRNIAKVYVKGRQVK